MKTNELLRRYVASQSETAFAELVRQNIALVYSAALRQVNGDGPAAEDVAQAVFTDLARKAPGLTNHPSLTGWLYTSTRYLASKVCRAEQSRRSREQKAHAMNQLLQSNDPDTIWQDLRPLLDDAMHDLSASDREAVLLRYFERLPLAEIGARLGLTDKAAHMRIERAIDRLRAALAKRGVTSTVAALGLVLTERAIGAVPAGLSTRISHAAVATVAAGGALGWGLLRLASLIKAQALPAAVALALAGIVIFARFGGNKDRGTTSPNSATTTASLAGNSNAANPLSALLNANRAHPASVPDPASNMMILHIVADDTGAPIPGAAIYSPSVSPSRVGPGTPTPPTKIATADQFGVCEIHSMPGPRGGAQFFSGTDGFVDELVGWNNALPSEFTLRLKRAAPIGGLVVDEDGKPVAGAAMEFQNVTRMQFNESSPETPHISYWVGYPTDDGSPKAVTDATGHWHIARFAPEDIGGISIRATHPDYIVEPQYMWRGSAGAGPEQEKQLLAGTFLYKLTRGLTMSGVIVGVDGNPVPGAKLTVTHRIVSAFALTQPLPSLARGRGPTSFGGPPPAITTNQPDGTFSIAGCRPGTNQLTIEAPGFAYVKNLEVNLATDSTPLRVILQPGFVLRLRVVGVNGQPVAPPANGPPAARHVFVRVDSSRGAFLQTLTAEDDGRVLWESAPERELRIGVRAGATRSSPMPGPRGQPNQLQTGGQAPGMTPITILVVQANGEEQLITLLPAESSASGTNR